MRICHYNVNKTMRFVQRCYNCDRNLLNNDSIVYVFKLVTILIYDGLP